MAKIMLVEDDNNLREIYEARLLAEGYQIVSARDGEEALAMAVKEKPDLIISDVMMPKISGFDMLDILRSTPETKNTKVIMMTALSQAEDQARAGKLGADRYLIKSQVTLEDVARVAREVLEGDSVSAPAEPSPTPDLANVSPPVPVTDPVPAADLSVALPAPTATPAPSSMPQANPFSVTPLPAADPVVPAIAVVPSAVIDPGLSQPVQAEEAAVESQITNFVDHMPVQAPAEEPLPPAAQESSTAESANPMPAAPDPLPITNPPTPDVASTPTPEAEPDQNAAATLPVETPPSTYNGPSGTQDSVSIAGKRVIQPPVVGSSTTPDLQDLLKQEEAKEAAQAPGTSPFQPPAQGPANSPVDDPNSIAL